MPRRVLGARSGLVTAPVGLRAAQTTTGCRLDPAELAAMVSLLVDSGGSIVDVTDHTGYGDVQRVVGSHVRRARDRIVLASSDTDRSGGSAALDATLRHLGTDHLDLWLVDSRRPGPPVEERVVALSGAVAAGKVRHLGLVGADARDLTRAHAAHPVAAAAAGYSLLERSAELSLLPAARSLAVGIVAYRPLAMGLLHGGLASRDQLPPADSRRDHPLFQPDSLERAHVVARGLHRMAARLDLSAVRLALAWLLAAGDDIVVTPATSSLTHLEMNLAAVDVVLTPAERAELTTLATTRTESV